MTKSLDADLVIGFLQINSVWQLPSKQIHNTASTAKENRKANKDNKSKTTSVKLISIDHLEFKSISSLHWVTLHKICAYMYS